jgi:asparagine synthase (glutamine-hydrolysing)
MCGLAGVYEHATREGSVSHEIVARMRDTLRHRGPDGEGIFVSEDARVGLGHCRLAIVDVARGAQPMFGRQGECLVYNGEIYNYPELRRQLESQGVVFESNCDTEVVLRLYERYGIECLARLAGMFAFALWDPERRRMLLARDRLGEKPLYWSAAGGRLIFGSEVKALLEHPAVDAEVNRDALEAHMTHLVTPSPDTLFRNVFKLAQGEMAICDANGLRVSRYWDLLSPRQWADTSLDRASATVRSMLERSVGERLMSDRPVGVLLSGGLDSSALVALLRERSCGLSTFSVGFESHAAFDERHEARRVAEHFGTNHHEVCVSDEDAMAFLPTLVRQQDEPLGDPVCIALHFVSELASEAGVKVVLSGEGSDELFWGYPRYQKIMRWWPLIRAARGTPGAVRNAVAQAISPYRNLRLREFAEGIAAERLPPMHMPPGVSRRRRALLLGARSVGPEWSAPKASTRCERPLDTLCFDSQEYEFALRLPERLLMRLDRSSMANGVEARVPFLDPELVEFVYRLPPRLKLHDGETKAVLRRAVADIVPPWVIRRRKQGFDAPVADWLGIRMGGLLRILMREDALRAYFDTSRLGELLDVRHPPASRLALWPVLNFALWHLAWIEGRDVAVVVERAEALPKR